MMLRQLLLVGALVATAAPVYAQQPAKSGADFAATVASSDMFEIKSSELGLEAASSNEVKSFARQMIPDHTKSSDRLKAAAKADKVDVPAKPDRKHAAMLT